jgi:hypothetical protein
LVLESFHNGCGSTQRTNGSYERETASCEGFDDAVLRTGLFRVHREVHGSYLFILPEKNTAGACRIDRILVPTEKLTKAGWDQGLVGVELKRSEKKLGPLVSQMLDYKRACWSLPGGAQAVLSWVFLFPCARTHNELASLMAQNRVGTCSLDYPESSEWHQLSFFCGEQSVLVCYLNQDRVEVKNTDLGRRVGSR